MIDFVENRPVEVEAIWGEPVRQALAAGACLPEMTALYQEIQTAVAGRVKTA
jgi:2-dehydropantoate 2-reductase